MLNTYLQNKLYYVLSHFNISAYKHNWILYSQCLIKRPSLILLIIHDLTVSEINESKCSHTKKSYSTLNRFPTHI